MTDDIYIKLREHLDSMPAGYPETDSGAELKMLKKFYTPVQAQSQWPWVRFLKPLR